MISYSYSVSLIIEHPSYDMKHISKLMGLQPISGGNVGDIRITRSGKDLKHKNEMTYWWHEPHGKERLTEDKYFIEEYLSQLSSRFSVHRDFFKAVTSSGGTVTFNIGWFTGDFSMLMTLSTQLLKQLSDLNVSLGLSVYSK